MSNITYNQVADPEISTGGRVPEKGAPPEIAKNESQILSFTNGKFRAKGGLGGGPLRPPSKSTTVTGYSSIIPYPERRVQYLVSE
jgi:hypothetical protein